MERSFGIGGVAVLAGALMAATAAAQAPPRTNPSAPKAGLAAPDGCADSRATIGQGGEVRTSKPDNQDLSERLARSNGVICPPEQVDPAIKAPTPQGGSMPVIPPPGSPGGDTRVQPK